MYGGLLALRVLARKYEFKQTEQRDVLATIVNSTFPQLLVIFQVSKLLPAASWGAVGGCCLRLLLRDKTQRAACAQQPHGLHVLTSNVTLS